MSAEVGLAGDNRGDHTYSVPNVQLDEVAVEVELFLHETSLQS